jgi:hypothetical protein
MTTTSTQERHLRTVDEESWLTATIRPVGSFGREDAGRLRQLLDALSSCASLVVLDLQATRVRSARAAMVVDEAAADIERRGGCLLCVNLDDDSRACLAAVGDHAILAGPVGSADSYAILARVPHTARG